MCERFAASAAKSNVSSSVVKNIAASEFKTKSK